MTKIPDKFTYPFCYTPNPMIVEAAEGLIARIDADEGLRGLFAEGKMMGVLMVQDGGGDVDFLYGFSGLAGGRSVIEGFVPPIFDTTAVDIRSSSHEESIRLQNWLFEQYIVSNARGESRSVLDIFADRGLVPPGGTGDCAAPKLLQYAYSHGLKPLAMGEFWYGAAPACEVRRQGSFYPSCTGKCGPLLTFMMQGLDVEPNPLDAEYAGSQQPELIFEDNDIIVVNKPAGMLSVPGRTAATSLLEWLQARSGEVHSCHRLDMDTSGVMVFARNPRSKANLEGQFASREVKKTYRARLVSGGPWRHAPKGTIALPLALDYYDRPRQMVDTEDGKPAVTGYEVLQILPDGEIEMRFTPLTGRSHQIRVHAAHPKGLGRPVKGDKLYGSPDGDRLFLMAESIAFRHPSSGEMMSFNIDGQKI